MSPCAKRVEILVKVLLRNTYINLSLFFICKKLLTIINNWNNFISIFRGRSSVGRAPPCQGGRRGSESLRSLQVLNKEMNVVKVYIARGERLWKISIL